MPDEVIRAMANIINDTFGLKGFTISDKRVMLPTTYSGSSIWIVIDYTPYTLGDVVWEDTGTLMLRAYWHKGQPSMASEAQRIVVGSLFTDDPDTIIDKLDDVLARKQKAHSEYLGRYNMRRTW